MIEAELKARLKDPDAVRDKLGQLAPESPAVYVDTYFDTPDGALAAAGRELRVRMIAAGSESRTVLTFKDSPVDEESGSKPEREVVISHPVHVRDIFTALGYPVTLEFGKDCVNYRFTRHGWQFLATLVRVPEIDGTFLEVETLVDLDDLADGLTAVRSLLAELGVGDDELTTDTYTGAVAAARLSVARHIVGPNGQ